jgi:hypothetical protein
MTIKKLIAALLEKLQGASKSKPVHWEDLVKEFVESELCTRAQLVRAMNSILMPNGNVSGMNHRYFIGTPA